MKPYQQYDAAEKTPVAALGCAGTRSKYRGIAVKY